MGAKKRAFRVPGIQLSFHYPLQVQASVNCLFSGTSVPVQVRIIAAASGVCKLPSPRRVKNRFSFPDTKIFLRLFALRF
jgi:hypothetical protein